MWVALGVADHFNLCHNPVHHVTHSKQLLLDKLSMPAALFDAVDMCIISTSVTDYGLFVT